MCDLRSARVRLLLRLLFKDTAFSGDRREVKSQPKIGGIGEKLLLSGRENQLNKIPGWETKQASACSALDIRGSPGEGITFEVQNCHIGGHFATNPAAEDGRRGRSSTAAIYWAQITGDGRSSLVRPRGRGLPSGRRDADTAKELCVKDIQGLREWQREKRLFESVFNSEDVI